MPLKQLTFLYILSIILNISQRMLMTRSHELPCFSLKYLYQQAQLHLGNAKLRCIYVIF